MEKWELLTSKAAVLSQEVEAEKLEGMAAVKMKNRVIKQDVQEKKKIGNKGAYS